MRTAVFVLQFILGSAAFFTFFAAMFNGLDQLMVMTAIIGLTVNAVVSALVGRQSIRNGVVAAVVFSGPVLLLVLLSLGDALVYGNVGPPLFWTGTGVAAVASGLLGTLVVYRLNKCSKKGNEEP